MTNEEITKIATEAAIAAVTASMNASQTPLNTPTIVPEAKDDTIQININPDAISVTEQAAEDTHKPTVTPEQLEDILNDVRLEVRAQYKQPWVEALKVLFQNPVAYATVNGNRKPLIDANQVKTMIEGLKKNGKFWPAVVTTMLTEDGNRRYVNTRYKNEDGKKWKLGSVIKKEDLTSVVGSSATELIIE